MDDVGLKIALIGAAGIGAQWLAWRMRLPAIVLLLVAGFVAGPLTGFLVPAEDFGDIYQPLVSLAVAVILFEGGLTLNVREIRETSTVVRRIVMFGGPLVFAFTTLAGHVLVALTWPTAAMLGAILVVTGPTVIGPLLRHARLDQRPASILKWESIINDPIGALLAVIVFEAIRISDAGADAPAGLVLHAGLALVAAVGGGLLAARVIAWGFERGHVPEYLKAPLLLAVILLAFSLTNLILEEAGLVTVTVMGIALANARLSSLAEIQRFKETISVFLVSGLFILLTASLTRDDLAALDARAVLFVAVVVVVVRPLAIGLATIGSGATRAERALAAWIAPRGVVAVAVSGVFGGALVRAGVRDAALMVPFTFAVVVATIVLHGFTLAPLARLLKLRSMETPGLLIVGASRFSVELARKLAEMKVPVLVADRNWGHLAKARLADIPTFFGDVLSEHARHALEIRHFAALLAATDNDAYNAFVCTDLGAEIGRANVYQLGRSDAKAGQKALAFTLGGRPLAPDGPTFDDLRERLLEGWTIQVTRLTDEFDHPAFLASRPEGAIVILWIGPTATITFASRAATEPAAGDRIVSFAPDPDALRTRVAAEASRRAADEDAAHERKAEMQ